MRVVLELQQQLYGSLIGNAELKKRLTGIYNYVPQDTKFPYLYLGKIQANDASTSSGHGLEVSFISSFLPVSGAIWQCYLWPS